MRKNIKGNIFITILSFVLIITFVVSSCTNDTEKSKSSVVKQENGGSWWQGGTLHKGTAADWRMATYSNKLATCGDFLTSSKWKGYINTPDDFNKLKIKAKLLVKGMDNALLDEGVPSNIKVSEAAAMIVLVATDLGPY